jgi:hypothetical protein
MNRKGVIRKGLAALLVGASALFCSPVFADEPVNSVAVVSEGSAEQVQRPGHKKPIMQYFADAAKLEYKSDTKKHEKSDYWQTPEETAKDRDGDCDDHALYLLDLLRKDGYEVYFVVGKSDSRKSSEHAWLEMMIDDNPDDEIPGDWYVVDPTFEAIYRVKKLKDYSFVPIYGNPSYQAKIDDIKKRMGFEGRLTKHYDGEGVLEPDEPVLTQCPGCKKYHVVKKLKADGTLE